LQAEGIPVGFFADQFSVSVLLYELLTQQVPYAGLGGKAGRPEFIGRAQDSLTAPSRASATCGRLPQSLRDGIDRVTLRGLTLDPQQRYPDRHAWLNDLFKVAASFRLSPNCHPWKAS